MHRDMRDDYSDTFAGQAGVRGKYFEAALRVKRLMQIDEDTQKAFLATEELNAGQRGVIEASNHLHLKKH